MGPGADEEYLDFGPPRRPRRPRRRAAAVAGAAALLAVGAGLVGYPLLAGPSEAGPSDAGPAGASPTDAQPADNGPAATPVGPDVYTFVTSDGRACRFTPLGQFPVGAGCFMSRVAQDRLGAHPGRKAERPAQVLCHTREPFATRHPELRY
jgi:hypothetical protein